MTRLVAICAVLMAVFAGPARAQGFTVKMGGDITIPAGTVHEGLAMTMNGRIQVDGTLRGDAMTMNGDVAVSGTVTGSVRTLNGNIRLAPTARVEGDVTAVNGRVDQQPGAIVHGRIAQGIIIAPPSGTQPAPSPEPYRPRWWERPRMWQWWGGWSPGVVAALSSWITVSLAVLAVVLALLVPMPLRRIAADLASAPGQAFAAGLLLWVAIPLLAVALVVSIVGIPAVLFLPTALAVLGAVGFAATSMLLGSRVSEALRRQAHPVADVILGAVVLAVVGLVPGLGWLALFLAVTWGAGGVLLRIFHHARKAAPAATSPPPAA